MATYRVEGLSKLLRQLQAAGASVGDLKDGMAEIAAEGARAMRSFAPSRTGALVASIRGNRAKGKAVVTAGRGKVVYASVVNYGYAKRNIKAQRFAQKASDQIEPKVPAMLQAHVNRAIQKAGLS